MDFAILILLTIGLYIFSSSYLVYDNLKEKYKFDIKYCIEKNLNNFIVGVHCILFALVGGITFYFNEFDFVSLYKYFILIQSLLVILMIDLKKKIIPNQILLFLLASVLLIDIFQVMQQFNGDMAFALSFLIGGAIGFIIFFISMLVSKGGVGAGDVKLFTIIGLASGFSVIDIIFYALLSSFVYSIFLLIFKKAKFKDSFPMAPFIYLGVLIFFINGIL